MTDSMTHDPEAIEREIRRTQEDMSRTVDKIGGQLSIKNMFNALLDKADDNNFDARMILDGARRNPVALGLIAAGAIWLVSDRDATIPSFSGKVKTSDTGSTSVDPDGYVAHMSSVDQRPDEDHVMYQRRRDTARSNYFMLERGHDEDESSFRGRLDALTETYRSTRHAWANTAKEAGKSTSRAAQAVVGSTGRATEAAVGKAQGLYSQNPIIGGLLAAVVGAVAAASLPITEAEQSNLGPLGQKATDALNAGKEQAVSQLREHKDALVEKAETALQPTQGQPDQHEPGAMSADSAPFIAAR